MNWKTQSPWENAKNWDYSRYDMARNWFGYGIGSVIGFVFGFSKDSRRFRKNTRTFGKKMKDSRTYSMRTQDPDEMFKQYNQKTHSIGNLMD